MLVELTEAEANELILLLDGYTKVRGLEVARGCDFFYNKLKIAHAAEMQAKKAQEEQALNPPVALVQPIAKEQ